MDLQTKIGVFLDSKPAEGSIQKVRNEVSALNREMGKLPVGSEEYRRALDKLARGKAILNEHGREVRSIVNEYDKGKAKMIDFRKLAEKAFVVQEIIQYGSALFQAGKAMADDAFQMEQLAKKAQTVLGPTLQAVTQEALKHANAMGLTSLEYINAATSAADLLIPMGFTRTLAADMSTDLVNLSGALSEWTGGQLSASQVSETLTKAMLGEREGLKSLGISINQADIDNRLAAAGMKGLTGEAKKQAEAIATLELVYQNSQDAQTSFANGAESGSRKIAELSAKFTEIGERLKVTLLPVFEAIVNIVDDAVAGIEQFFNFISTGSINSAAEILPTVEADSEEEARLAAEKAKAIAAAAQSAKNEEKRKNEGKEAEASKKRAIAERKRETEEVKKIAADIADAKAQAAAEALPDEIERELALIELRYKAQLERIKELEAKNIIGAADSRRELEAQIAQEKEDKEFEFLTAQLEKQNEYDAQIKAAEDARILAEDEALLAELEAQNERDLAFEETKQEAYDRLHDQMISEQQREIDAAWATYDELLQLAQYYGIDTAQLEEQRAAKLAEINRRYEEETTAKKQAERDKRIAVAKAEVTALTDLLVAAGDLFAGEAGKQSALQKAATLAQIAFDTAAAISSLTKHSESNPANTVTFGLAGVAQFASGLARILINIKKAKDILGGAPDLPQKVDGGFTTVRGQTDGMAYNAKYIGKQSTGMLDYDHPVILANERGREYYVDADTLRNPYAANYVRAIENIRLGKGVMQRAEGGFNQPVVQQETVHPNLSGFMAAILATLQSLDASINAGIPAIVHDDTIRSISSRKRKLDAAAGFEL